MLGTIAKVVYFDFAKLLLLFFRENNAKVGYYESYMIMDGERKREREIRRSHISMLICMSLDL